MISREEACHSSAILLRTEKNKGEKTQLLRHVFFFNSAAKENEPRGSLLMDSRSVQDCASHAKYVG